MTTHIINAPRPGLNTAACGAKVTLTEEQAHAHTIYGASGSHELDFDCPECNELDHGDFELEEDLFDE